MKNSKKYLTVIISALMVLSSFSIVLAVSDYNGHWAESYINDFITKGIVSGDINGDIRPNDEITRSEFVKVINRTFEYTDKSTVNFSDVSSDKWYYNEFLIAKTAGYIAGDNNGNANPEAYITRAEVCVILSRILQLDTTNTTNSFIDSKSIPSWALGCVAALVREGYIKGYNDGSIRANNYITRAEAFSLVARIDNGVSSATLGNSSSMPSTSNSSSSGSGGNGSSSTTTLSKPYIIKVDEVSKKLYFKAVSNAKSYTIKFETEDNTIIHSDTSVHLSLSGDTYVLDMKDYINEIFALETVGEFDLNISIMAVAKSGYSNSGYTKTEPMSVTFPHVAAPALSYYTDKFGQQKNIVVTWDEIANVSDYEIELYINDVKSTQMIINKAERIIAIDSSIINKTALIKVKALSNLSELKNSSFSKLLIDNKTEIEGAGTVNNPYIITSALQFANVRYHPGAYFILAKDIDLGNIEPIKNFSGYLSSPSPDEKHTIKFNISSPSDNVGLISTLTGIVENIIIEGSVSGGSNVGSIAGTIEGTIKNCINYASVSGKNAVGGIAGSSTVKTGFITDCINYGTVTGTITSAGGIAGYVNSGIMVTQCANYGDVISSGDYVGGIIGTCYTGNLSGSFNAGSIQGASMVGGLVGYSLTGNSFSNCYNVGTVNSTANNRACGLIGYIEPYTVDTVTTIKYCYNTGEIVSSNAYPLFSADSSMVRLTNCYYVGSAEIPGEKGIYITSMELQDANNEKTKSLLLNGKYEFNDNDYNIYPSIIGNAQIGKTSNGIPLSPVTGLNAIVNKDNKTINYTWADPVDTAFDYIELVIVDKASYTTVVREQIQKGINTFKFNYSNFGTYYSAKFTVKDNLGNTSEMIEVLKYIEMLDIVPPSDVTNIVIESKTYELTVSFVEPTDSDYKEAVIYLDGTLQTRLPKGTSSFTIKNLNESTEYVIKITTVDTSGNESDGLSVNVKTAKRDILKEWLLDKQFDNVPINDYEIIE